MDRVIASGCPPMHKGMIDLGDFPLTQHVDPVEGVDAEYGPRRFVLDNILMEAAMEAGAEVRQGFSVSEIVMEDHQVIGIRGSSRSQAGRSQAVTEQASIVIGADGQHSLVARTVGATSYNERPVLTCSYYSYWSGLPCDGLEIWMRSHPAFLLAFPTNFDLICVAVQVPVAQFPAFRRDIEGYFTRTVKLAPSLAERVMAGHREEQFYGTADLPNRFRKPYGPGWALVGDAGYVKDPITARGISDAFRHADLLAEAVDDGLSGRTPMAEALASYEQRRNEEACNEASFGPIPAEVYEARARAREASSDRG